MKVFYIISKKQQRFQGMSTSEVGHGPGIGHAPWWAKIYQSETGLRYGACAELLLFIFISSPGRK